MQLELVREGLEELVEARPQFDVVPAPVLIAVCGEALYMLLIQALGLVRHGLAIGAELERADVLERGPVRVRHVVRPLLHGRVHGNVDDRLVQIHDQRKLALLKQMLGVLCVDADRLGARHLDARGRVQRRKRRLVERAPVVSIGTYSSISRPHRAQSPATWIGCSQSMLAGGRPRNQHTTRVNEAPRPLRGSSRVVSTHGAPRRGAGGARCVRALTQTSRPRRMSATWRARRGR